MGEPREKAHLAAAPHEWKTVVCPAVAIGCANKNAMEKRVMLLEDANTKTTANEAVMGAGVGIFWHELM